MEGGGLLIPLHTQKYPPDERDDPGGGSKVQEFRYRKRSNLDQAWWSHMILHSSAVEIKVTDLALAQVAETAMWPLGGDKSQASQDGRC